MLEMHTDAASAKVTELARIPAATLLAWDPEAALQIRLRATVAARPGTAEEWAAVPDSARGAYGGTPPPGALLEQPEDHDPTPDPVRFIVLTARIEEIETLHLGPRHSRALFRRRDGFRGQWIAP